MTSRNLFIAAVAVALLAGCGKSFDSSTGGGNTAVTGGNGNDGQSTPPTKTWSQVSQAVNGTVDGSMLSGQLLIQVDSVNQALIFYLPIPISPDFMLPITSIDIPQLPGTTVYAVVQPDGSTQIAVKVPLKYIVQGSQLTSYNTLPNGDPLPFMPAGENHGFALQLPQMPNMRLNFYFTANAAAVFIELPTIVLQDPWTSLKLGFPIRNADKTEVVGYFAFVPNKANFATGVYIAGRLPTEIAVAIDNLLRY